MKALIPIAGLGTRLLPLTKVIPKALLPVYDRPAIQWIVEEMVSAGIDEIIFVYSPGQEMLIDYFGPELSWLGFELERRAKFEELQTIRYPAELAKFHFVL